MCIPESMCVCQSMCVYQGSLSIEVVWSMCVCQCMHSIEVVWSIQSIVVSSTLVSSMCISRAGGVLNKVGISSLKGPPPVRSISQLSVILVN